MASDTNEIANHCNQHMVGIQEWVLRDGAVDSATKACTAAAICAANLCEEETQGCLLIAHKLGATSDQVREIMNIVTMTQGCAGEVAAAKACSFFEDLIAGNVDLESSIFKSWLPLASKVQ